MIIRVIFWSQFWSYQGRTSQLWSRAIHNAPKRSRRGVNEIQNNPENNTSVRKKTSKKHKWHSWRDQTAMYVPERMVFSKKDPINPATKSLCISNQDRTSEKIAELHIMMAPKKSTRCQRDAKRPEKQQLRQTLTCKQTMTKMKGPNDHICSWTHGLYKKGTE